jgi:nickel/cobalt transporter (NicO) family protein
MSAEIALMAAAAGVGVGHAVLPDHWLPLAVVSRSERYPVVRTLRVSAAAGLAHVLLSVVLGAVVIGVGLRFQATIVRHTDLVVGGLLVVTGVLLLVLGRRHARGHGHGHGHGHSHGHGHPESRGRRLLALVVPFGAAASPDLTALPVFLAASAIGVSAAVGTVVAFSVATLAAITGLTVAASLATHRLRGGRLDRYANPATAAVLVVIGSLVGVGAL